MSRAREAEIAGMRRAIELSALGLGTTSPNPVVGCVILDSAGRIAGEGYHEHAGGPHAEVRALAAAGNRAWGGTALVTLEPCAHTGRTGPCTHALIEAGIRRVVAAVSDPHVQARGGAHVLRDVGIDVELGLLAEEAARVNEAWLTFLALGRPHVTWKYAASLDGRVAAVDGSSRWITGAPARADAHRLRAEADAVLVGSGTLTADDPHLAVRHGIRGARAGSRIGQRAAAEQPTADQQSTGTAQRATDGADGVPVAARQPLRVVVDTRARIRPDARVLDDAAPTLVAVAPDADTSHLGPNVDVIRLPRAAGGGLDLSALLAELRRRNIVAALLEGGPTLAGAFLAAGLVDRVVGYLAPVLVGGDGLPMLTGAGATTIADALRLRFDEVRSIGGDVRITARLRSNGSAANATSGDD